MNCVFSGGHSRLSHLTGRDINRIRHGLKPTLVIDSTSEKSLIELKNLPIYDFP